MIFFFPVLLQLQPRAAALSPQTLTESNKARSSCQRGGVKEVLGVTYVALNCSPSVLPSYSRNVSLIVPLKSHVLHRESQISIVSCQNFMMLADLQRVSGPTLHLQSRAVAYLRRPPHPCLCARTAATPPRCCCPRPRQSQSPPHLLEDAT